MDTKRIDIDYEKNVFDEVDVNPYEIVIAVSKTARQINDKAQKYMGPEVDIRPINIALKKLEGDEVTFVYDNEEKNSFSNDSSAKNKENETE